MVTSETISFPPDPNPKKPKLKMPAGAWDTHFHVCGPPHIYPYVKDRMFTPPAAPIEHYLAVSKVLGFERGVVIHHPFHGFDFSSTLDAVKKSEGRFKAMVGDDPSLADSDVKRLHAAGVRGIRIELLERLGGHYDEKNFNHLVSLCARNSWVVSVHIDPPGLLRLAEVIRKIPAETIIENFAHINPRDGMDQPALRTLLDLAEEPHIWLKTASAYRMLRWGANYVQITELARVVNAKSPDRVIWGTDWPHGGVYQPGQMMNDGDIIDMLLDCVPDETAQRKLLADNPKKLFDFD